MQHFTAPEVEPVCIDHGG